MRPFCPHTLADVVRAIDGGLGLIAADMPDGTLFVLKRDRRAGGLRITHYADTQRSSVLGAEDFADRTAAINAFSDRIGLHERL